MSVLLLVRVEEWLAVLLGLLGAGLGSWFAWDNHLDLRDYRAKGWNGFAELAAVIGMRSGASKAILHLLLIVLPALSLMATPPPDRYPAALIFFGALSLAQAVVIAAQLLNQRDRARLRRGLGAQTVHKEE